MEKYNIHETPQDDYLFQRIFASKGNEDMLAEILEDLLDIKINNIEIKNEFTLEKIYQEEKSSRIDIKVVADNRIIDIEMQIKNEYNMKDRSLYYGAALYHEALEEGIDYKDSKEVIVISILSFNLFKNGNYLVRGRIMRDDIKDEVITDKLSFYYIQLPKFLKQRDKKRKKLAQWLYFISQRDKGELEMAVKENEKIARAEKLREEAVANEQAKRMLWLKEKARFDEMMNKRGAYLKGEKKGEKKGKMEIAKKMLDKGMTIEEIADITGLSEKEITKKVS